MAVVVRIDRFSGPLALLLHLIRQEQMDIFDINIHDITKQYLDSIKSMKKLNLEVAGDFIAMASTLIQIKSKMLLPQYNEEGEVIEDADPRRDLVQRLIEYQMYQEAGHNIYKRALLGRDVWIRGRREEFDEVKDDSVEIEEENALYSLISMYRAAYKKMNKAVHRVAESLQSIADRVWEIRDRLMIGHTTQLTAILAADGELATGERRGKLLITFLSLLELAKIGIVDLFQGDNFSDIHITAKKEIDRESISSVETYDSKVHSTAPTATASALTPASAQAAQSGEIWLSDGDRNDPHTEAPAQLPLLAVESAAELTTRADEAYEIEAASDLDIELEEQLYGQAKEQQKIDDQSQRENHELARAVGDSELGVGGNQFSDVRNDSEPNVDAVSGDGEPRESREPREPGSDLGAI